MRWNSRAAWAALALASATVSHPALADPPKTSGSKADKRPSEAEMAAFLKSMYKVEPLTAEQQARLPEAQALIAKLMPPGTMQQMMGGMFDKMLGPILAKAGEASSSDIARELGVEDEGLELDDEDVSRIAAIIDPAWKERHELQVKAIQRAMTEAMTSMEPAMRKGMAEAYAANFNHAELLDIDAFFSTPSGATYARKSYGMASDPRIIAASMEALPNMLAQMQTMEADIVRATSQLPPKRGFADLTAAQRKEIADLTGLDEAAIREGMAKASAKRDK